MTRTGKVGPAVSLGGTGCPFRYTASTEPSGRQVARPDPGRAAIRQPARTPSTLQRRGGPRPGTAPPSSRPARSGHLARQRTMSSARVSGSAATKSSATSCLTSVAARSSQSSSSSIIRPRSDRRIGSVELVPFGAAATSARSGGLGACRRRQLGSTDSASSASRARPVSANVWDVGLGYVQGDHDGRRDAELGRERPGLSHRA
jgi:hypothetical protein